MDMFGANAYANHDDFLTHPGKPQRALTDELMLGLNPTYRLYECANQEWIFLALVSAREKMRFKKILANTGIENDQISFSDTEPLASIEKLEALFKNRSAEDWEELLAPHGIGCVRADGHASPQFWVEDEQVQTINLTKNASYPGWGTYKRHGPTALFNCGVSHLKAAPSGGEHSEEILSELGYDNEEIEGFVKNGVVWKESP